MWQSDLDWKVLVCSVSENVLLVSSELGVVLESVVPAAHFRLLALHTETLFETRRKRRFFPPCTLPPES